MYLKKIEDFSQRDARYNLSHFHLIIVCVYEQHFWGVSIRPVCDCRPYREGLAILATATA
jgi:hypothetical protein